MASLICFSSCFISSPASFADGNFRFHLKSPNRSPKFNSERFRFRVKALKEKTGEIERPSPDEVTKKYGLEAGLWKIFSSKEEGEGDVGKGKSKGEQAKELLAKYGGAYLATSITLSLISFSLCYALISAGIDVQALLQKVGISANETGEKVGTFALAYAAHKAASPIRFPPTVALTPIVASWIGKKVEKQE
ncbi:uncharacterized protein LOC111020570 isoform X1 [Momordica charantia]|uniref:Uncharacterized protein LOC111020570 isoform X1 n=1 Tax=Momordica charantia TaxID=3673 RepID=A0A6J1DHN1_MOMCH|nr:uncharacterized protein LOC111020570 isoform X1 [Momordica charantia]